MTIALILGWVGLSGIGHSDNVAASKPAPERNAVDRIRPMSTPPAVPREDEVPIVVANDRVEAQPVRVRQESDGQPISDPTVSSPDPAVDLHAVSRPRTSLLGQSQSLAMAGRRPEKAPNQGRELFERDWVES